MADPTDPTTPEPTLDEAMLASLDEGLGADAPADPPADPDAPKDDEPAPADPAKPADAPADPAAKPKDEKDEATEQEITALGLKDKAAARFRELTEDRKALSELRGTLEQAGIKDLAELPKVIAQVKDATDLIGMVTKTGATPEQYGKTLDYLEVVNRAMAGDPKAGEQAWAALMSEVQSLAQALGKELPGVHDPLDAHADLKAAVEAGTIDRTHALEVARARSTQTAVQQQQQQTREQQARQQAAQTAEQQIAALDAQLLAADPHYKTHRRNALSAQVAFIKKTMPPQQWAAATKAAYDAIAMLPVAEAPKPPPGPVRPGPAPPPVSRDFDDPFAALDAGIKAAGG